MVEELFDLIHAPVSHKGKVSVPYESSHVAHEHLEGDRHEVEVNELCGHPDGVICNQRLQILAFDFPLDLWERLAFQCKDTTHEERDECWCPYGLILKE